MEKNKIRVAIVKFGGMNAGGTEKLVQSLAANLNKECFSVDYFWCNGAPYLGSDFVFPPSDPERVKYMENSSANLIEFKVKYKDVRQFQHPWVNTDFWDKFNEDNYDVVLTGRAGHSEYPFYLIKNTPIIDIICLANHVDPQKNIVKSVHISEWQKNAWIKSGGNASIAEMIPIFDELPTVIEGSFRKKFNLKEDVFVFGFHQRAEPSIFSPIPLEAYSKLEKKYGDKVSFLLLGGANLYREQAKKLGIKNINFIEHTGNRETIGKFLNTLSAYTHGRKDGETAGLVFIEAMQYGLPIVSHTAVANGHVETIGEAGKVVDTVEQYYNEIESLLLNKNNLEALQETSLNRYKTSFDYKSCVLKYESLIREVYTKKANNEYGFVITKSTDSWLEEWVNE